MKPIQQQGRHEVERQVDAMLNRSAAFHQLPPQQQARIRADTADVVETMANNELAQIGSERPSPGRRSMARSDPYAVPLIELPQMPLPGQSQSPSRGSDSTTFTGGAQPNANRDILPTEGPTSDFGSAVTTGVTATGEMVRQVNFPAFVAELIQGVFQAVVDASIDQMKAYGELVQSVTMSLSDFRDSNVTENQARDHLVSKAPQLFQVNIGDQGPRVGLRPDADSENLPDLQGMLGLENPVDFLDEETIEQELVPAAKNDLAKSRQALLATTLLMGINRIVVTNGRINARMNFQFTSRDFGASTATDYDYENQGDITTQQSAYESESSTGKDYKSSNYRSGSGWRSGSRSGESSRWSSSSHQTTTAPMVTLTNVTQSSSQAELEAKGQLAGTVDLNFKSETVDLNKVISEADIFKLEGIRSAGRGAGAPSNDSATPATEATQEAATGA
ncbi:MAG: hypothetical protein KZQ88_03545 [Candidatus Thiodiazotropha sp. (ex Dulcina madagascariensis)]|nr:hypothetical protein [Candidatus Thiodiazotropha sp. (ex Dulcina madagascariensis)]MCU7925933.1 hypothetical protein [Candidatus Thiodiazotropha sp. (ex Dulcina madagascariensis)]